MRLDVYVAKNWPQHSRSTWQKLIETGHVRVNGELQTSVKFDVDESDQVDVEQPERLDHSRETLPVIYEDDNVIVINKPVGVLTHSKGALNDEFTVAEYVRPKTTYQASSNRPGIIHRLDRATSGVILCVKNDETASYIAKQFSQRTAKKQYAAVTSGIPTERHAIIDLPIGRNPSAPSTFRVDSKGKSAETEYDIAAHSDARALLKLRPKTGRTHQLRVHLAYINTPILGDTVYGRETADRMYLHAESLEITLPGGKRAVFSAAVPPEFSKEIT
jgi:23S rRNA pseudouridine1911/1915/1917 synthase